MDQNAVTRYPWVDYAKCIGILLVVYGHIARGLYSAGIPFNEHVYKLIDSVIYSFHMPLFFFLSGLFFYNSLKKRGSAGMVFSKMDTIIYPYVVWSLLQGSIEVLFSHYTNGTVSLSEIVNLFEPRAQFWFLYALFFITILASVIYSNLKPASFLTVAFIFSAFFVAESQLPEILRSTYIVHNFVFFALGIWFNEVKNIVLNKSKYLLLPVFLLFVFSQWLFHGYFNLTYEDSGLGLLVLAIISILFVIILSMGLSRYPIHFLLHIGYASMAIFLMHILAGGGVRVILQKVFHVTNLYAHLLFGFCLAVLIPIVFLKLFQRWNLLFLIEAPRKISSNHWYQKKFGTKTSQA